MTQKEELDLYRKALVDWTDEADFTFCGFCWYFLSSHDIWVYKEFEFVLPTLYGQRLKDGADHYKYAGCNPEGRQQRVQALKNAIEILENKLKQEG